MAYIQLGKILIERLEERPPISIPCKCFFPNSDLLKVHKTASLVGQDNFDPVSGCVNLGFHTWIIRGKNYTALVDCCNGNHKIRPGFEMSHQLNLPYLERLRKFGLRPEDIDLVFCTHLHPDHVGWNTRLHNGAWVPTFPNARYVFSAAELEATVQTLNAPDALQWEINAYLDSVLPVRERGLAMEVDGPCSITDELTLQPAPGHTVGQYRIDVTSSGRSAIFSGDIVHSPIQVLFPDINCRADKFPALAASTRWQLLRDCVEREALLLPAHFRRPYCTRIRRGAEHEDVAFVPSLSGN